MKRFHLHVSVQPTATWKTWQRDHLNAFRMVAIEGERPIGWASLAAVSGWFLSLPLSSIDRLRIQQEMDSIGRTSVVDSSP